MLSKTLATTALLLGISASATAGVTAYSNLPPVPTYSVISNGFQATSTSELGSQVSLAGTERGLEAIRFGTANWAYKSKFMDNVGGTWVAKSEYSAAAASMTDAGFYNTYTVNVYAVDSPGVLGAKLGSVTQNVLMAWRPEPVGGGVTQWEAPNGALYNGYYQETLFDFTAVGITLPDEVVLSVEYNTQNRGYTAKGIPGPWDEFNLGLSTTTSVTGTNDPNGKWVNSTWSGAYGDGGATGVFRNISAASGSAIFEVIVTPEPTTAAFIGMGLLALSARRRRVA